MNLLCMNNIEVNNLLIKATFKVAKTMPTMPHEYTVRKTWDDDSKFVDVVLFIRENGIKEKFWNKEYIYLTLNGYKYWTMGNPVCYIDKKKTFIINRVKI